MKNLKINGSKKYKELKYFFILGAAKCGTTSLYYYINQHSKILMSTPKETLFFEKDFVTNIDWYVEKYFKNLKNEKFLGEARQRNLYLPYVPQRIAAMFPDAKLIISVRNPIERAYSHYLHRKNHNFEHLSFEDAIEADLNEIRKGRFIRTENEIKGYLDQLAPDGASKKYRTYIDCGYYAEQIERYLNYYDRNQLKIVFLEDIRKNVKTVYCELLRFLDQNLEYEEIDFFIQNKRRSKMAISLSNLIQNDSMIKKRMPKKIKHIVYAFFDYFFKPKTKMNPEIRKMLIEHYWEHNRKLEKITGRDLSHWDQ